MTSRARSWVLVAAAAVLVAAAAAIQVATHAAPAHPVRFWVSDHAPGRIHDAPGGAEIPNWTPMREGNSVMCAEASGPWIATPLARIGIRVWTPAVVQARVVGTAPEHEGWHECVVDNGPWPAGAAPDAALAGEWAESAQGTPTGTARTLHADGRMELSWDGDPTWRWARVGDVLLFGAPTDAHPDGQIVEAAVVQPDGRTYRTTGGWIGRRADE